MSVQTATRRPATPKQIAFAARLYTERYDADNVAEMLEIFSSLTTRDASTTIDNLLRVPVPRRQQTPNRPAVTEQGMYRLPTGEVFKVQRSRESGNVYAKALVVIEHGQARFEYAAGAIRKLSADDRMSVEDAKAFGLQFGVCCCCGATLTDPKSIAAGIGPVCAKRL